MTVFDLIVIGLLIISTGLAAVRGGLLELATLIALALAGLLSLQLAPVVIAATGNEGSVVTALITHGLLIALIFLTLYVIIHILTLKFPLSSRGKQINRVTGGIFGFVRGLVVIGLGFLAYGYYLDEDDQHDSVRKALTRPLAASSADFFRGFIPESTRLEATDKDQDHNANENADQKKDAAEEGYARSDRAGLSEVITTVTTSDGDTEDDADNDNENTPEH